jgi:hypothetical protein
MEFKLVSAREYCLQTSVNFEYTPGSYKYGFKKQTQEVIKRIHGYLNHVGGVLKLLNARGDCSIDVIDVWMRHLIDQMLKTGIPQSLIHSKILFHEADDVLYILMKKSPELVTFDYKMFSRGPGAQNMSIHDIRICYQIMTQCRVQPMLKTPSLLDKLSGMEIGSTFPVVEKQSLEFKMWSASNVKADKIGQKVNSESTTRCLSGFANLLEGGDYCLGIKEIDREYVIEGYQLNATDRAAIEKSFQSFFDSLKTTSDGKLILGSDWKLTFIPLTCKDDSVSPAVCGADGTSKFAEWFLVHIRVNHVPGGVFLQDPVCINNACQEGEPNSVQFLDLSNWASTVKKEIKPQQIVMRHGRKVRCLSEEAGITSSSTDDVQEQVNIAFPCNELSYTMSNPHWEEHCTNTVNMNDIDLTKVIPLMTNGNFVPPRQVVKLFQPDLQNEVDEALTRIAKELVRGEKYVAFAYQSNIASSDHHIHVCDILILPETRDVVFVSIVKGTLDDETYFERTRSACRTMKEELVLTYQKYRSRVEASQMNICMKPFVYNLNNNGSYLSSVDISVDITIKEIMPWYLSPVFEGRKNADVLKLARVVTMHLRDKLTTARLTLVQKELQYMTEEQIMSLLDTCHNRFTLTIGPPGSGNLVMVLFLCMYFGGNKSNNMVKVITGHPGVKSLIDHHDNCSITLVENDEEMAIVEEEIAVSEDLFCVIVTDVFNMTSSINWNRFYTTIFAKQCYLHLLGDPPLQNYLNGRLKSEAELSLDKFCLDKQPSYTRKYLTEVHRNSRIIASFMKVNAVCDPELIRPRSRAVGDDIILRYIPDLLDDSPTSSLLVYVRNILELKSPYQYSVMDLAILVGGSNQASADRRAEFYITLFRTHLPDMQPQHANHPINGLIIDTVENFAAQDSPCVIFVVPDEEAMKRVLDHPRYRTYVASRATLRLDILVPSPITARMAVQLGMVKAIQVDDTKR